MAAKNRNSEMVAVRVPHSVKARLDEYAAQRGISRGAAVVELVEAALNARLDERKRLQIVA